MRLIHYAYILVFALFAAHYFRGERESSDFTVIMAPPLISAPLARTANPPAPQTPSTLPAFTRTLASAEDLRGRSAIEKFLENQAHIKTLVARDLKQLVDTATTVEIPNGKIVRQKGSADDEHSYREMKTDWGAEIKKISNKERMISESFRSANGDQVLRREFNSDGRVQRVAMRWNRSEGFTVDLYKDGQISNLSESINGETTTQKWDLEGKLIAHTSVRVVNGQFEKLDHLRSTVTHPMEEVDDADGD